MNIRTRAGAALALAALTASAALGACAGPGTAILAAPVPAVQQEARPAGLPDGALRGQVASITAITLVIKNETDEVWNLDAQTLTGVPNTRFASVLGPHEANRAVVNSSSLDGAAIAAAYFNADESVDLQVHAKVPLIGQDSFHGAVYNWDPGPRFGPDPRYTVTTSDISGFTPTVTLTISYA